MAIVRPVKSKPAVKNSKAAQAKQTKAALVLGMIAKGATTDDDIAWLVEKGFIKTTIGEKGETRYSVIDDGNVEQHIAEAIDADARTERIAEAMAAFTKGMVT